MVLVKNFNNSYLTIFLAYKILMFFDTENTVKTLYSNHSRNCMCHNRNYNHQACNYMENNKFYHSNQFFFQKYFTTVADVIICSRAN